MNSFIHFEDQTQERENAARQFAKLIHGNEPSSSDEDRDWSTAEDMESDDSFEEGKIYHRTRKSTGTKTPR